MIAVCGTPNPPLLNGQAIPSGNPWSEKGRRIKFSHIGETGFRWYLAVAGGIDLPIVPEQ